MHMTYIAVNIHFCTIICAHYFTNTVIHRCSHLITVLLNLAIHSSLLWNFPKPFYFCLMKRRYYKYLLACKLIQSSGKLWMNRSTIAMLQSSHGLWIILPVHLATAATLIFFACKSILRHPSVRLEAPNRWRGVFLWLPRSMLFVLNC